MPRKSSITRSPDDVRAAIDKLIRQGRLTLDEIQSYVREKFGDDVTPSRSALGRYTKAQEAMLSRMRGIDTAARAVVEELGESPDDKAGQLLVQSITTLATDAALRAQEGEGEDAPSIEDVRKLARASSDIMRARRISQQERQEIARMARERQLAEQEAKLDKIVRQGGMTKSAADDFRNKILLGQV